MNTNIVQMLYARRDGALAHIADVGNGLGCRCACLCCAEPVVAKQGDVLSWHFSHKSESSCAGPGAGAAESQLHELVKYVAAANLPGGVTEPYYPGSPMQADAGFSDGVSWVMYEVVVSHDLGVKKEDYIVRNGLTVYRVEPAPGWFELSPDEIWALIQKNARNVLGTLVQRNLRDNDQRVAQAQQKAEAADRRADRVELAADTRSKGLASAVAEHVAEVDEHRHQHQAAMAEAADGNLEHPKVVAHIQAAEAECSARIAEVEATVYKEAREMRERTENLERSSKRDITKQVNAGMKAERLACQDAIDADRIRVAKYERDAAKEVREVKVAKARYIASMEEGDAALVAAGYPTGGDLLIKNAKDERARNRPVILHKRRRPNAA